MFSTSGTAERRALVVLAAIAAIWALRASYSVTMPLAFAAVVIAAIWPVQTWLAARLSRRLSYAFTIVLLLLALAGFAAAIYFSAAEAVRGIAANWPKLESTYDALVDWADRYGVPLSGTGDRRALLMLQSLVADAYTFVFYLGFVAILVVLGLPEVPAVRSKLQAELDASARREVVAAARLIAEKVRRYLGVTFLTSVLTGVCTAIWSLATGLELALTWGVLNFLLNFVPVLGNIVGIIPPTLFAIIQTNDPAFVVIVFLGFAAIQLVISNVVYPLLQGHSLSLSPVAVLVALSFWSWIWGIAGALIAVPLTAALVIVFDDFEQTRWISKILAKPGRAPPRLQYRGWRGGKKSAAREEAEPEPARIEIEVAALEGKQPADPS